MGLKTRGLGVLVVLAGATVTLAGVDRSLIHPTPDGTITDRADFLPNQAFEPLPGKVVGVLASGIQTLARSEGRNGPANVLGFSTAEQSYRWVYVPVKEKPQIGGLRLLVGEFGDTYERFDRLSFADPKNVQRWGIGRPYTLVEVEVNGGLGSPDEEMFVGTNFRVLDGSNDYPLIVADVIDQLRTNYHAWLSREQKVVDSAMADAQKAALGGRLPTGPRETEELLYVTWLPNSQQLKVHFRTRISDGLYQYVEPKPSTARPSRRIPKRQEEPRRAGTMFGVELGLAYVVSKAGRLETCRQLPIKSFQKELPLTANARRPSGPMLTTGK